MKTKRFHTLSVAIATYNEENFIGSLLDQISNWAEEIIIVDGSSTDKTQEIIKKYSKVKVITTSNKPIFHINKQMAIDACTRDWVLQLDADEIPSENLKNEIDQLLSNKIIEKQGYWLNRANYFLGRFLKKGGQYPDPTLRLYQRGLGSLPCKSVHEQAVVQGTTGHLKNDLLHYADRSFTRYLTRHNRYTTLISQEITNPDFFDYFILKPHLWFLTTYFRHKGFQDGFPGFVFSFFSALRFPIAYVKYWENKTTKHIQSNDWQ